MRFAVRFLAVAALACAALLTPTDAKVVQVAHASSFCSVLQAHNWLASNYPTSYNWSGYWSGNDFIENLGNALLLPPNQCFFQTESGSAYSCSNLNCAWDVTKTVDTCNSHTSGHDYTLHCNCGDVNGCWVTWP